MFELALRDFLREWTVSLCLVAALAAVLAPLLVLFGVKHGIISTLTERMSANTSYREVQVVGSGHFGPEWFTVTAARPDVGFVVPRTRAIAATVRLHTTIGRPRRALRVDLLPSAPGDPLLPSWMEAPRDGSELVLSAPAAERLGVSAGARLNAVVDRVFERRRESVWIPLTVVGVLPLAALQRDAALVSIALLTSTEDFRDGAAVPERGWLGRPGQTGSRRYAGFRLYARTIDDVSGLRDALVSEGLEVRTRAAEIDLVQSLDRNLTLVFWLIAGIGGTGFVLSLGANGWVNVTRKRRALSLLRLVGFTSRSVVMFPLLQSLLVATFGILAASSIYAVIAEVLQLLFSDRVRPGEVVCELLPIHLLVAGILTVASTALSSTVGGYAAAGIEPNEGLRDV